MLLRPRRGISTTASWTVLSQIILDWESMLCSWEQPWPLPTRCQYYSQVVTINNVSDIAQHPVRGKSSPSWDSLVRAVGDGDEDPQSHTLTLHNAKYVQTHSEGTPHSGIHCSLQTTDFLSLTARQFFILLKEKACLFTWDRESEWAPISNAHKSCGWAQAAARSWELELDLPVSDENPTCLSHYLGPLRSAVREATESAARAGDQMYSVTWTQHLGILISFLTCTSKVQAQTGM